MAPGAAVVPVPGTEVSAERVSQLDAFNHYTIIHRAVSVDSVSKAREVLGFLSRSGEDYFWTSGKKINPFQGDSVKWANGATQEVSHGQYPW